MAQQAAESVQLRRKETSTPWGFRMMGGRDMSGLPLFIAQVSPQGIARKAGLCPGDAVLRICETDVTQFTHQQGKNELLRAGNEVDFVVIKGVINTKDPAVKAACGVGNKRSELDEGSIDPQMNQGTKYRTVVPKSYQILEQQLAGTPETAEEAKQPGHQMDAVHSQTAAAGPSSIFDRKINNRSDYLVAQGQTIQKQFGEQ